MSEQSFSVGCLSWARTRNIQYPFSGPLFTVELKSTFPEGGGVGVCNFLNMA